MHSRMSGSARSLQRSGVSSVMNYVMKVEMENQKLTSTMCDMFDVTTKNGKKTQVYFDVQLILALENQMFSTDKKPFTFKYKKPKK